MPQALSQGLRIQWFPPWRTGPCHQRSQVFQFNMLLRRHVRGDAFQQPGPTLPVSPPLQPHPCPFQRRSSLLVCITPHLPGRPQASSQSPCAVHKASSLTRQGTARLPCLFSPSSCGLQPERVAPGPRVGGRRRGLAGASMTRTRGSDGEPRVVSLGLGSGGMFLFQSLEFLGSY